jgi:dTDP-4-amino-4,6-dideoxygalactose transaminase
MSEGYRYDAFGLNLRLTDLQAAVGLPQLERLDEINETRARHAAVLTAGLADLQGLHVPRVRDGDRHVFHQYTVRIDDQARVDRDALKAWLTQDGIGAAVYYPRLVCDRLVDACPTAAAVTGQVLSLPVHQHLSDNDLNRIVRAVRTALV